MSKLKSDSKWNALTDEQRDTLEGWLFEENISYREAAERAEKEFGIVASSASVARFYHQMAKKRQGAELKALWKTHGEFVDPPLETAPLTHAAIVLVANRLIHLAAQKPGNVRELVSLARVLVANEAVEVKKRWVELEQGLREDALRKELQDSKHTLERAKEVKDMFDELLAAQMARSNAGDQTSKHPAGANGASA
jgi:hypothetical protein